MKNEIEKITCPKCSQDIQRSGFIDERDTYVEMEVKQCPLCKDQGEISKRYFVELPSLILIEDTGYLYSLKQIIRIMRIFDQRDSKLG